MQAVAQRGGARRLHGRQVAGLAEVVVEAVELQAAVLVVLEQFPRAGANQD